VRICIVFALTITLGAQSPSPPADPAARRLNRYEYNATIRDLLAIPFEPASDFPVDDAGYGFDNIASVLSLSPALMEKYLAAAEKIARAAIVPPTPPEPTVQRYAAREFRFKVDFEADYDILIAVHGTGPTPQGTLLIDGVPAETSSLQFRLHLGRGNPQLRVELAPDIQALSYVEIRGPYDPKTPPLPESYARVFRCGHAPGHHTLACARTNLADLARRAYRRPVTDAEVDGLVHFVESAQHHGDSIDDGMQLALEAILVSPRFLFRIEPAGHLDDFQFASRLSYFLWSSMPDDELFQLALTHRLRDTDVLHAQIHRMLLDSKSRALVENFGGQWLQTRNLASIQPDPAKFPQFDASLRHDMQLETRLFFQSIIRDDRPITDLLAANYTFLNDRLARFYGIPGVEGSQFRRVDLPPDSHRGGILTEAGVLTVSSYPARTSPVLRGKWILQNLLDSPPPAPPPNVPTLDVKAAGATRNMRQQLEQHRANPACRGCHSRIDPLGFDLENYDAIGQWRTQDGSFPVDSGDGPEALKHLLLSDQNRFARCVASKLATYALGRKASWSSATGNQTFAQLVEEIMIGAAHE
jgi:Protein of unknown function (DUF1592)/Protein of unknown function (DUF1588)/Protein of unknown function (DUF1587)/Protein of unknown function (DUF1595)/Protein of unknown function (DUF1585)